MATKKTTTKATAAKTAPKKAAAKTPAKATTVTRVVSAPVTQRSRKSIDTTLPDNLINIIIAEVVGTFILTLVAISAVAHFALPLYVGLTLVVMVLTIGAISGSHINPAVTFGLWSMRKLKTVLVPFYWAAQFLGAMAAIVLLGALSNGAFAIHFDHFMEFSWSIFALELVGTAIFIFGLAAAISRSDLKQSGKALAIGMSLMIGIVATNALLPHIKNSAMIKYEKEQAKVATEGEATNDRTDERGYPRELSIGGATLNPAVAMAVAEKTESELRGSATPAEGEKSFTRLSLEVILATLIGAAVGGNLFLLVNYRSRLES